jgi:hypothetical protein
MAAVCLSVFLTGSSNGRPLTGRLRDGLVLLFPGLGLAAGTLILFEMNAAFDHKALPIYEAELAESDPA